MPSFTVTGRPVPFKRHAGIGRRAYNQPEYSAWRDAIAWRAREARVQMLSGYVFVMVGVFVSHHPGDADNYAKGPLDACQGVLYEDDRLVKVVVPAVIKCQRGEERMVFSVREILESDIGDIVRFNRQMFGCY